MRLVLSLRIRRGDMHSGRQSVGTAVADIDHVEYLLAYLATGRRCGQSANSLIVVLNLLQYNLHIRT